MGNFQSIFQVLAPLLRTYFVVKSVPVLPLVIPLGWHRSAGSGRHSLVLQAPGEPTLKELKSSGPPAPAAGQARDTPAHSVRTRVH